MTRKIDEKEYEHKSLEFSLWKKLFSHMRSQKKNAVYLLIIRIIIAGFDIGLPYLNKLAIDTFVTQGSIDSRVILYCGALIVLAFLLAITVYALFIYSARIEQNFAYELREKAFRKLQTLSFSYFDKTPIGWLIARVTTDITRLAEIISWGIMDLLHMICIITGSIIVMFLVNWQLALWVVVVVPILVAVGLWFQVRIHKNYRKVRKINSKITSSFNEGITGAKTTKSLHIEEINRIDFKEETLLMRETSIKAMTLSFLFNPVVVFIGSFVIAGILVTGGNLVLLEVIQFGTMIMFLQYALMFLDPLKQIAHIIAELQMAQANAERVLDLLDTEEDIQDSIEVIEKYGTVLNPKKEAYEPMIGSVEFKDVSFHYVLEEPILNNFNLQIPAGSRVALVGETGSGKSTIINLLCRFYEPNSGKILIDGKDYRERSIGWLHSNLGYVLQSPHLFSGTIQENLEFGNPNASFEEIQEACKLVGAHQFIEGFEKGYQTEVGEGGSRLSTGQKQLISFARALLANPVLFVLDEATSSVDTETEQVIQSALEYVLANRTSFIVAHRLSTVVNASIILVIDKGEIIESGNHNELMKKKGQYYTLYTNQFNEELEKKLLKKE